MNFSHESPFVMFSTAHIVAVLIGGMLISCLFFMRRKWHYIEGYKQIEKSYALSLFIMEILYQTWLWKTNRWDMSYSLPLELCSISVILAIVLLWTESKYLYDFVFYAGMGGALQAIMTPDIELGFPHFRYFHFFYTHFGIIFTACYFTWYKGYLPTFKGIMKTLLLLNLLLPIVFMMNGLFDGNYMFLRAKPSGGSLLDYLGPYPWYLFSLEFVAFFLFLFFWVIFRLGTRNSVERQSKRQ